jgi:hypothetical protein
VLLGQVVGLGAVGAGGDSCQRSRSQLLLVLVGPCTVTAFQPWGQIPREPNIS